MTDDELLARLDAWHKEGGSQTAGDVAARLRELIADTDRIHVVAQEYDARAAAAERERGAWKRRAEIAARQRDCE